MSPYSFKNIDLDNIVGPITANADTREIYVIGPINNETVSGVLPALRSMDQKRGPISLVIHSNGGDEDAGWAIYDALRLAKNRVVAEAYGACQSIAALILQGANTRLLSPDCRFMIHNGSASFEATTNQIPAIVKELQFLTNRYHEVLAQRSSLPLSKIKKLCRVESFMSASQAVEAGFADGIICLDPKGKRK